MLFAIVMPDKDTVLVPPALPDRADAGGCHEGSVIAHFAIGEMATFLR
jgi:hypothetical protein